MLFDCTEDEILKRDIDWCNDISRVCLVMLKCLNIPCRIVHLVNINKAFNGHVVCEAYYENHYGMVYTLNGIVCYYKRQLDVYELLNNKDGLSKFNINYLKDYTHVSINEYNLCDKNYNYNISKPNTYYL